MKTKQGKSVQDIQLKEATYCRGDMFHSLAFLKQFWVLPNSHLMERKGKKLFPKNRKDILGKREKLRGHKSVGEFFDTCILRVRSPTLTRTLYPVIVVTRKPEEVTEIRSSKLQTDTLPSKHQREASIGTAVVPPHKCFRKSTYDIGNLVCFKLPKRITIELYFQNNKKKLKQAASTNRTRVFQQLYRVLPVFHVCSYTEPQAHKKVFQLDLEWRRNRLQDSAIIRKQLKLLL